MNIPIVNGLPIIAEQVITAKALAEAIWEDKNEAKFSDMACADTKEIGFIGYLGEIIYADFYQLPRPILEPGRIDAGYDFVLDGQRIQVKTTPHDYPVYLTIFKHHINAPVDIYSLIKIDRKSRTADIVAEIPKTEFDNNCFTKDFGYGERFCLKFNKLDGAVEWARK